MCTKIFGLFSSSFTKAHESYKMIVAALILMLSSVGAVTNLHRKRAEESFERNTQEDATKSLPPATMSMNDLVPLLHALERGIPFSFAHFNDGEITALHCREGRSTSKKKQPCSAALQNAMRQSLVDRADNFYVGAICPCSFTISQHVQLLQVLNVTYPGIPASTLPPHHKTSLQSSSSSSSSSSSRSIAIPTDLSHKQKDQFGAKYNHKQLSSRSDNNNDGGVDTMSRPRQNHISTKKNSNNARSRSAPLFLTHGKKDLAVDAVVDNTPTTTSDTSTSLPNTDQSSPPISSLSNRQLLQTHTAALQSKLSSINLKKNRQKNTSSQPKSPPAKPPKIPTIFDSWQCPLHPPILEYPTPSIQPRLTVGNLFASGNYAYAKKELTRILNVISHNDAGTNTKTTIKAKSKAKKRGIHVVAGLTCNGEHSMYSVYDDRRYQYNHSVLPFPVKAYHAIASRNAFFYNYEEMRTLQFLQYASIQPGDVVLILAGPVGRILASEWSKLAPLTTFLDLGSMWDAELCGKHAPELQDFSYAKEDCMYVGDKNGIPV